MILFGVFQQIYLCDSRRLRSLAGFARETGGCFGVFQQIYTVYESRRLRGWNRFAGSSLVTFAAILVRLQAKREGYESRLRSFWRLNKCTLCMTLAGCAWFGTVFPGSSLVPFAASFNKLCMTLAGCGSSLQAKREGGEYSLWFFETIILCMILAGCAGGTFFRRLSSHVCVDFGSSPSETGGW